MAFVKLNRNFFENFLWKEARNYSKAEAWLDLIQLARFEASTEMINGKVIEVQRGELPASRRFLELRWDWGSTKVSNFLKILEDSKMIKRKQTNGHTIITLCNYDKYNSNEDGDKPQNKPSTNQRQTTDKPPTNQNKEYKNYKNEEEFNKEKESKKKNSRFSPPTILEIQNYFLEKKLNENLAKKEAQKFFDFYDSKNWFVGKNKMAKWKSAASGWINRMENFNQNATKSNNQTGNNASNRSGVTKIDREALLRDLTGDSQS